MTEELKLAVQRGKCWIHPDGSITPRSPQEGSIFWRDDPPQLELYTSNIREGCAQIFPSQEQIKVLHFILGHEL